MRMCIRIGIARVRHTSIAIIKMLSAVCHLSTDTIRWKCNDRMARFEMMMMVYRVHVAHCKGATGVARQCGSMATCLKNTHGPMVCNRADATGSNLCHHMHIDNHTLPMLMPTLLVHSFQSTFLAFFLCLSVSLSCNSENHTSSRRKPIPLLQKKYYPCIQDNDTCHSFTYHSAFHTNAFVPIQFRLIYFI